MAVSAGMLGGTVARRAAARHGGRGTALAELRQYLPATAAVPCLAGVMRRCWHNAAMRCTMQCAARRRSPSSAEFARPTEPGIAGLTQCA